MVAKIKDSIVFVGRLEEDTGLLDFLKWIGKNKKYKVTFVGDGILRQKCEKFGVVHGFTNPNPFLQISEWCVPGGYLSYIEAKNFGCKIMVFPNNPLKSEYWKEILRVRKFPSWAKIANEYIRLYNSIQ